MTLSDTISTSSVLRREGLRQQRQEYNRHIDITLHFVMVESPPSYILQIKGKGEITITSKETYY